MIKLEQECTINKEEEKSMKVKIINNSQAIEENAEESDSEFGGILSFPNESLFGNNI